jgi:hypothetical protein
MIRCPTLMTAAENDPLAIGAQTLFDALTCPKALIKFSAGRGRRRPLRDDEQVVGEPDGPRLAR